MEIVMGKQVKKYGYSCRLDRVIDGDTCDALIDLGFDTYVKKRIRFYGVDTWESRTRNLEEKKKGLAAKAYVEDLLKNSDDGKFSIISHGVGKYGRVLGEIFVKGYDTSVNQLLMENGHAYQYHGEKKKTFGS
jgi:micrococcal nuclease